MTASRLRRPLLAALACLAVVATGCGNKHDVVTEAETEGIYLDVGPLDYQVQLSRVLNPAETPDRGYFSGLTAEQLDITSDEIWFAVFIRVANATEKAELSAEDFEILDTKENVYHPIEFQPDVNPIAYQAKTLAPEEQIPSVDSVAADGPTQGAMLLFKLPFRSLENRPLEFKIKSPKAPQAEGVVNLDV